jgi:hypothetical protein
MSNKGIALLTVMIIMSALVVVGSIMLTMVSSESRTVYDYGNNPRSFYLAEAGVDLAIKEWDKYIEGKKIKNDEGIEQLPADFKVDIEDFKEIYEMKINNNLLADFYSGYDVNNNMVSIEYKIDKSESNLTDDNCLERTRTADDPQLLKIKVTGEYDDAVFQDEVSLLYYWDGSIGSYKGSSGSVDVSVPPIRIYEEKAHWDFSGKNLEVTIYYTGNLMNDISNVSTSQFAIENLKGTVNPNAIERAGKDSLKLIFEGYNFKNDGVKKLTYTQSSDNTNGRLKDIDGNYVLSPDNIDIIILSPTNGFIDFIINNNVFVYGNQYQFSGNNVYGYDSTIVVKGNLVTDQLNGGSFNNVTNIYIGGKVILDGGSAGLGSQVKPGVIYIDGDLSLWSGTRHIYGDVYVNGDFKLKDAKIHGNVYVNGNVELGWTPEIADGANIYYTGTLTTPNNYNQSIIAKCIKTANIPNIVMPDFDIPPVRSKEWYDSRGYVSGKDGLQNNIKIFAEKDYTFSSSDTFTNVIIVGKGNIELSNWMHVTGVIYAPNGKVTFDGAFFTGVVIAKDGFYVTSGGSTVTFKNIKEYISDPNDFPF